MAETKAATATDSGESKEVVFTAAEAKALKARLDEYQRKEAEAELEKQAEALAKQRVEEEEKAAKEAEDAEHKSMEKLNALVEAKFAAMTSGRKYRVSHDTSALSVKSSRSDREPTMIDLLIAKAKGDPEARPKLIEMSQKAADEYGIKAMSEATGGSGYLVPPQFWQQGIAEYRLAAAKVRQLCTVINGINTNLVYIPRETGVASVGWTSENAAKPSTDQTFGQIAINIFTLAGISKVSNQLLEDSSPAVDQIVRKDLGRLLGQAEDIAFINGSGTGQPTGILNTANILTGALGGATIADAIAAAIAAIQSNYFGDPEAIVIHPKHLSTLRTAKDNNLRYIFEPGFYAGNSVANRAFMDNGGGQGLGGGYSNMPGMGGPQGTVWGLPVYADANVPTPGGAGQIIVAAFSEMYVLERTGVTIDVSSEAGTSFEQNQTWFRGEERLGFTAARQPNSIYTITALP